MNNRSFRWLVVPAFVVLAIINVQLPSAQADPPAFAVQARLVDAGETAKPDKAPEQWVSVAVAAAMAEARRPKPKNIEVLTDWVPLSLDKPTTIKHDGLSITAYVRQENKQLQIGLGMSAGNANAEASMTLDAVPGSQKVQVTAYQQYLAVEVVQARAKEEASSEPVRENGAELCTVAQTKWTLPVAGGKSEITLGLKVTNHTEKMMQINIFDTIHVVLEDAHGTELQCRRIRDASFIPEPLILKSGESQIISRNATLAWMEDGKNLRLSGPDGAGGHWYFNGPSKPGQYNVRFVIENNEKTLQSAMARPAKHVIDPKEAPFWMGKAATKGVAVELVESK